LALLDVVYPDVVKLDLHLVQSQPGDDQARILSAVLAHRERTGAVLLAEGIESDEHQEQALAMDATLGAGLQVRTPRTADWPEHVTQGYAVTMHAARGVTAHTAHAVLAESARRIWRTWR
jgi:EAL domain-containing protein (putative c-di-GMP-specific phosphodiesterase class I)